jgi:hypothetical protein
MVPSNRLWYAAVVSIVSWALASGCMAPFSVIITTPLLGKILASPDRMNGIPEMLSVILSML